MLNKITRTRYTVMPSSDWFIFKSVSWHGYRYELVMLFCNFTQIDENLNFLVSTTKKVLQRWDVPKNLAHIKSISKFFARLINETITGVFTGIARKPVIWIGMALLLLLPIINRASLEHQRNLTIQQRMFTQMHS